MKNGDWLIYALLIQLFIDLIVQYASNLGTRVCRWPPPPSTFMGDTFPIYSFFLSWLLFCIFIIGPSVTYLDGFTHVHIHTRFLMRGFVDGCMFGWVSDGLFLPVDVLVSGCCCCCYYYSMIQNKNNMIQKCSCSSSKIDFSLQHFCLGGPWREGGGE